MRALCAQKLDVRFDSLPTQRCQPARVRRAPLGDMVSSARTLIVKDKWLGLLKRPVPPCVQAMVDVAAAAMVTVAAEAAEMTGDAEAVGVAANAAAAVVTTTGASSR